MKQIQGEFDSTAAEVLDLISGQRKDLGASLNAGIKIRQEADGLLKEVGETVEKGYRNIKDLRELAAKSALAPNEATIGEIRLQDMTSRRLHIEQRVTKMTGFVKDVNRLLRAFPNDQRMQQIVAAVKSGQEEAAGVLSSYDKDLNEANS